MNEINRINEDESDVVEKEDSLKIMYFPSEIGNVNYWFSEQLHALEEPILYKYRSKEIESYRLTILPTFVNPLSVRFEINSSDKRTIYFYSKSHSGAGGYSPKNDSIIIDTKKIYLEHRIIGFSTWDTLTNKIEVLDFWKQDIETLHSGRDGTEYILEGFKNGRYHVIHRWSPSINSFEKIDEFLDLVIFMLRYGGLEYQWHSSELEKIIDEE